MKGVWHIAASALALTAPWGWGAAALAQNASGSAPLSYGSADAGDQGVAAPTGGPASSSAPRKRTRIVPYLELDQSVFDQITPRQPVVTYTTVAAGADMLFNSVRTTGLATIRYEHHFSESRGQGSSDTFTGIARTTTTLVPHALTFDFGGLATRTSIGANGGTLLNPVDNNRSVSQVWSLYGGPSLSTHAGIVGIKASYALGYNAIDQLNRSGVAGQNGPADLFGHSLTQQAKATIGVRPGEVLPFGIALTGSYLREDMSNLDQRLTDAQGGVEITQPVSRNLAVVGDLNWEKIQVSQRDALFDANGNPVLNSSGQYVTDTSQPRKLAYKTDGLTWDIGVVWRPSRRTMASAFVGQRYDSTTYYGSLFYAPSARQTLSVAVYDSIFGFGSGLMSTLQQLPTDFAVARDPFSGNVGSCFTGTTGGSCVGGALGSAQALIYHGRGVNASYGLTFGQVTMNIGGGYASRRYLTAPGTVLAAANGALDQTVFVSAGLSGPIDQQTRYSVNSFASIYRTDQTTLGNASDWGVNGILTHHLTDRLVGTASLEMLGVNQQASPDQLELLGQLGLRYNFH